MAAAELKQLGRYDLTRILGKGAMGIVYEGMDPKLHRKVAIKTILKGHLSTTKRPRNTRCGSCARPRRSRG